MNDLNTTAAPDTSTSGMPSYTLWQLVLYMLRLGTLGFGGPVALVGYMYRDLVEQRGWISDADYKEGMALAQLMPGPLAAQLAIYLGYVHFRLWGATLVGLAFVLPSFVMVVALGFAYKAYGGISWMQAVFYGVGASVIGIIALSAYKLTTKSVGQGQTARHEQGGRHREGRLPVGPVAAGRQTGCLACAPLRRSAAAGGHSPYPDDGSPGAAVR